ncbi:hypothetical protein CHUAL_012320 [Chamberlinius hualienensis]
MKESSTWHKLSAIALLLISTFTCCTRAVIVITDLDFGQIPQPPRNTASDLVHVRVTSGRLGGRFFYRVSETGLPSDLPALMIPFGFFYHPSNYGLQPRTQRPQQTQPQTPLQGQQQQQPHQQQQQHHQQQQQLLPFGASTVQRQQPQLPSQAVPGVPPGAVSALPSIPSFPSLAPLPFSHQSVTQLPLPLPLAHQSMTPFTQVTPPPAMTTTTTTEKSS